MQVVIVGGGFGGVRTALSLANKKGIDVTLISDKPYFEYYPALYRTATGRSPLEVAIPLQEFFTYAKNITIVEDTITTIDATNKILISGESSKYKFDSLVLALGNNTDFYGIKGLRKYAYGIKTVQEALELKRILHEQLLADSTENNYVVIGAGPSGVELSAELTSYLKKVRRRHGIKKHFRIELIEAKPKLLSALPQQFSDRIKSRLIHLGVKVMTGSSVEAEKAESITLPHGSIQTHTVVWTAGIKNNPLFKAHPDLFSLAKMNRVVVDEYLQAIPDIYVIGDSADTLYSGMAQTAVYDAKFVAKNLVRQNTAKKIKHYKAKRPIYAIPVGSRWVAVSWGHLRIYGWVGWLLRRLADLRLFITFLPIRKALSVWRHGFVDEEACPVCKKR